MGVVRARIQTVEDIYALLRQAVTRRRAVEAIYDGKRRLMCPHRLGRNNLGQLRVLCYQYGGESQSGLAPAGSASNWRCIAVEKLSKVKLIEDNIWQTAPNHSRPQTCVTDVDVDAEDYPVRAPQQGH
jgi:hypothetical protein